MKLVHRTVGAGLVLLAAATLGAGPPDVGGITISPDMPGDLPASDSTLPEAAAYAWNEFIALNWPAVAQTGAHNTRGVAEDSATFGVPNDPRPLVWHTFRSKVEIFPPNGTTPNGYTPSTANSDSSYGYDAAPVYTYLSPVSPANGAPASASVPWINLDETNEIGLDAMYAGVGTGQTSLNGLILFTAKANRQEYEYVAAQRYFDSATVTNANAASTQYVVTNKKSPPPDTAANLVSLPDGTMELKAAWRELTPAEARSGRFYQTRVRYYPDSLTYVDATMGLVALHIIHKTPSRPHFVFATFEQADNILSPGGAWVEDEDGNLNPSFETLPPMDPVVTAVPAKRPGPNGYDTANIQHLGPDTTVNSTPGARLYYVNSPGTGEPDSIISVNRRVHGIPQAIIDANQAAHAAMTEYAEDTGLPPAVWQYYKLVNVQYQPINKGTAGANYAGPHPATYYQANIVVETDQNLQTFSGRFQPAFVQADTGLDGPVPVIGHTTISGGNLITDWCGSNAAGDGTSPGGTLPPGCAASGDTIKNVYTGGKAYNMGGCMGCHGNAQVQGGDFSFLLVGGPVNSPEPANAQTAPLNTQKYPKLFGVLRSARAAARASPTVPR